jgi:hypothetical protein
MRTNKLFGGARLFILIHRSKQEALNILVRLSLDKPPAFAMACYFPSESVPKISDTSRIGFRREIPMERHSVHPELIVPYRDVYVGT